MTAGENVVGALGVQNLKTDRAFSQTHLEVISTVANQAAIALENARLFRVMHDALSSIANRERYQNRIVQAVAAINELGVLGIKDALGHLAEAARADRVTCVVARKTKESWYWENLAEHCSGDTPSSSDSEPIPTTRYRTLTRELNEKGWLTGLTKTLPSAERKLLEAHGARSYLIFSVPGKGEVPGFLRYDRIDSDQPWSDDEIEALQLATHALTNTFIREELLSALSESLDETESLYNAAHNLSLAGDLNLMVAAVMEGLPSPVVQAVELLLTGDLGDIQFEVDPHRNHEDRHPELQLAIQQVPDGQEDLHELIVAASWYSGRGIHPSPTGTKFSTRGFEKIFYSAEPTFIPDLRDENISDPALVKTLPNLGRCNSLAVLPLWANKRQVGAILLKAEQRSAFTDRDMRVYPPLASQLAFTIENQHLIEKTQSALTETESLYQAISSLSVAKSIKEILEVLCRYTILGDGQNHVELCLFDAPWAVDQHPEKIEVAAQVTTLPEREKIRYYSAVEMPFLSLPPSIDTPTWMHFPEEKTRDKRFTRIIHEFQAATTAFVPLVAGGSCIGYICASYPDKKEIRPQDRRRLSGLIPQAAVTVQNQKNLDSAQKRAAEALTLFSTSQRLSEARSEKDLFQAVLDACSKILAPDAAAVYLFKETQDKLYLTQVATFQDGGLPGQQNGTSFPARIFPFIDDLQDGQKVIIPNTFGDPQLSPAAQKYFNTWGASFAAMLPVGFRGHPVGVLFIGWKNRQVLPPAETTFLENLTAQLSVTLDHLRLLREIQVSASESHQRSSELSLINRVVSAVSSAPDLHTACKVVVDELVTAFPVVSGTIGLLDEKRTALSIIADQSRDGRTLVEISLPVAGNQSFEQVIASGEPLVITQAQQSQLTRPLWELLRWRDIQSITILPLVAGKEVIGAVILDLLEAEARLTAEEIRLAQTIVYQAAASIQNTRLLERTQAALAETGLLYQISQSIAEAASPQDLMDLLVERAMPGQAQTAVLLYLQDDLNRNSSEVEIVGYRSRKDGYREDGRRFPLDSLKLLDQAAPKLHAVPNVQAATLDPGSASILRTLGSIGGCIIPLRTSGRLIGWVLVSATDRGEYSPQEVRLLQIVGDGFAVALDKMRLLEQTGRRALELQTAATVARDTSGTLSLDILLKRSVEMLRDRFGFYHASVFLLDESGTYAIVRESTGEAGEEMKQRGHKLGVGSKSIIGTTTASGLPLVVNDVTRSDTHYRNPLLPDTRAELGIPLKIGDHVIGALDVQSTQANAFHADDVAVLQVLADQIAVAIENARAYELSQRAVEEMRQVDQFKSKFLANMSHELRTPLNSIIGFSKVILKGIDGPITDIQQQDLTAIYNSGQHLLNLINDILDLSKVEAGKMELAFDEVNLADLINSVMSTGVGLVKDKPIQLVRYIQPDLPVVRGDTVRIRQVLINLISNAAKFTDRGVITIEAAQQTNASGHSEVIVRVSDTGSGIPPEHQKKLFQPFSQVDDSPTRKTGGTGLGLSICRSLIELHGGRIGLERSKMGEGSVFYFTLPVYRLEPASIVDQTPKPTILLIDDDERGSAVYRQYFESRGYQIVHLQDPHLAMYHARRLKPAAIVMELVWKNSDIWFTTKQLKSDPELSVIPVLFSSLSPADKLGNHMGTLDIAFKPVETQALHTVLSRLAIESDHPHILAFVQAAGLVESMHQLSQSYPTYQVSIVPDLGQDELKDLNPPPDCIILDLFQAETNKQFIMDYAKIILNFPGVPTILLAELENTPAQHAILSWVGQTLQASGQITQDEVMKRVDDAIRRHQKFSKRP